jgi:hypothetical protein
MSLALAFLITSARFSYGFMVSDLAADCRNGQVFLTMDKPEAFNLQYNVYRSPVKITSFSQLNSSTYLGFVRDFSSKNVRLSQLLSDDIYYRIKDNGTPLSSTEDCMSLPVPMMETGIMQLRLRTFLRARNQQNYQW